MIHKIINFLLRPLKVKYIKQHFSGLFKPHYYIYINVGTILSPVWFAHPWRITEGFKNIYVTYKITKTYYEFIKDRPYNDDGNCNTVDLHEQLMK